MIRLTATRRKVSWMLVTVEALLLLLPSSMAFSSTTFFPTKRQIGLLVERKGTSLRMTSQSDLSDVRVMVNGMPGKMATAAAESCLRKGLQLTPCALTGPDIPEQIITVHDAFSGRSADVKLIPSHKTEEVDSALEGMKAAGGSLGIIAVDYTHPSAVNSNAVWYTRNSIPFVMGTTGGDRQKLMETVQGTKLFAVIAPNMGKQIVAMQSALEYLATNFPLSFEGYSLSVTESHQKTKADTSGTAKSVVASIKALTGDKFDVSKDIQMLRSDKASLDFGVDEGFLDGHAFHTYTLTSPDGSVEFVLKHNVLGRTIYADGTADAVIFLAKKLRTESDGTVYNMIDVLKEGALK